MRKFREDPEQAAFETNLYGGRKQKRFREVMGDLGRAQAKLASNAPDSESLGVVLRDAFKALGASFTPDGWRVARDYYFGKGRKKS